MAAAYGITVAELHPQSSGGGLPMAMIPHLVGRAFGASPEDVRAWPEQDVYDELLLTQAESAAAVKRQRDAENDRKRAR